MSTFGRVLTAMVSPFTADRALDLDGAQRLAAHLVAHGNDGIVVCGSTGESPTVTHEETLALLRGVVEAVGDRATVVAGTGKYDTAATVELSREAEAIGVDGLLVVTPYYNKPSQRGLHAHFTTVAGATSLPVMLYNIPSRTACEVQPETLLRILEDAPNVRAVKDATGNFRNAAWLRSRAPERFDVYSGDDVSTLPLLALGAAGVVSVAGHLVGEQIAQMVDVFPTDPGKAREIHQFLLPLFDALFVDTNPVPLKAALGMVGLPGGPVRSPLADADESTHEAIGGALRAVGALR